jgi:hypothetical protein
MEGPAELAIAAPRSEVKALPQGTQRNTEEEQNPVELLKSSVKAIADAGEDFTAENAEVAEAKVGEKEGHEQSTGSRTEDGSKRHSAEGIPGVESARPFSWLM